MSDDTIFLGRALPPKPYPGLRPFRYDDSVDESPIFKGRDWQTDNLVARLAKSHLVAVLGPSGCGKSSLIRAGLIPRLEEGEIYAAGGEWRATVMRPGNDPCGNLVRALAAALSDEPKDQEAFVKQYAERFDTDASTILEVNDLVSESFGPYANVLLVIDQFEEIFRADLCRPEQAEFLVELILSVFHARPKRIYLVIAMRTDYLEHCALYLGLPDALNMSLYVCPRLDDDQLRAAICEPVEPYRGGVNPALVERLVKDVNSAVDYDADRLPLMQHLLLQMWNDVGPEAAPANALEEGGESEAQEILTLELKQYEDRIGPARLEAGGLARALDRHADEIYRDLTAEEQAAAEVMFRLMSYSQGDGRYQRRSTSPGEIAALLPDGPASRKAVERVLETYSAEGCAFIHPIEGSDHWDLVHECLIRKWRRLRQWADDEARNAQLGLDLNGKAQDWATRKSDDALLYGGRLDSAQGWFDEVRERKAWAGRYGIDLGAIDRLLEASRSGRARRKVKDAVVWGAASLIVLVVFVVGGFGAFEFTIVGNRVQIETHIEDALASGSEFEPEILGRLLVVDALTDSRGAGTEYLELRSSRFDRRDAVSVLATRLPLGVSPERVMPVIDSLLDYAPARRLEVYTQLAKSQHARGGDEQSVRTYLGAARAIINLTEVAGWDPAGLREDLMDAYLATGAESEAEDLMNGVEDVDQRAQLQWRYVHHLLARSDIERARSIADTIENLAVRSAVFADIAARAEVKDLEQAKALLSEIDPEETESYGQALMAIVDQMKARSMKEATKVLLEDSEKALGGATEDPSYITWAYAMAGNTPRAVRLLRGIEDPRLRRDEANSLALDLADAGEWTGALELVLNFLPEDEDKGAAVYWRIVKGLSEKGDVEDAESMAESLKEVFTRNVYAFSHSQSFGHVAVAYAGKGQLAKAKELIRENVRYSTVVGRTVANCAVRVISGGDFGSETKESLVQLVDEFIDSKRLADEFSSEIGIHVRRHVNARDFERAILAAELQQLKDQDEATKGFAAIASGLIAEDKAGRAEKLLNDLGEERLDSLGAEKDRLLERLAVHYAGTGKPAEAEALMGRIDSAHSRQLIHLELAVADARSGEIRKARLRMEKNVSERPLQVLGYGRILQVIHGGAEQLDETPAPAE